jgi:hypothetical protein
MLEHTSAIHCRGAEGYFTKIEERICAAVTNCLFLYLPFSITKHYNIEI